MEVQIYNDRDALSHAAAKWVIKCAQEAVKKSGRFSLVLTGGSSPTTLYELLAGDLYKDQVPWESTHVFFGDERWVHHDDVRNNAKMAYDLLLNHVPVPKDQIVRMSGELAPEDSANQYEFILKEFFSGTKPAFDLVLLGMGDDGHTLSLFPGTDVLQENGRWVRLLFLEEQKMYRITLTPSIVNEAKNIIFLVMGGNKSGILKKVIEGKNRPIFPAELIQPKNGKLIWFIDKEAGSGLSSSVI